MLGFILDILYCAMKLWVSFKSRITLKYLFYQPNNLAGFRNKFQTAPSSFDVHPIFKALQYYPDQSHICSIQESFWDLSINLSHRSALRAYKMLVGIKSVYVQLMGPEVHKHFHGVTFSSISLSALSMTHSSPLRLSSLIFWKKTGALSILSHAFYNVPISTANK